MRTIFNVFEMQQKVFERERHKILPAIELACKVDCLLWGDEAYDLDIHPSGELEFSLGSFLVEPQRENRFRVVSSTTSMHSSYLGLELKVSLIRHNPVELRIKNTTHLWTDNTLVEFTLIKSDDYLHMESERDRDEILTLVEHRLRIVSGILQGSIDHTSSYPCFATKEEAEVHTENMATWPIREKEE